MKRIWLRVQYVAFTEESRKCEELNKEVWWDLSSYWYDEDYRQIDEENNWILWKKDLTE